MAIRQEAPILQKEWVTVPRPPWFDPIPPWVRLTQEQMQKFLQLELEFGKKELQMQMEKLEQFSKMIR